ncbi:carboxyl-terminal PDZ ligand of neuronal nitric oxide synthase protein-like isoform X1 [Arapaima gigas]
MQAPVLQTTQLLQEQLAAETRARSEAQGQVGQLLLQNRDLLQHVTLLLQLLRDMEAKAHSDIHCEENSPRSPVFSLSRKNSHSLDGGQPLDSSPGSRPGKASASTVFENCTESCFSLLSLGSKTSLETPGEDGALVAAEVSQQVRRSDDSGRQMMINTWAVQRVTEWFQQTIPRLNAPHSAVGPKQADKMRFLGHSQSTCSMTASLPHTEPSDTYSLPNSENESWSTSEDSGVRCEKSPLSPQHQSPPEAECPCLSVSSSFSGQQEDFDGFIPASFPQLSSCTLLGPDSFESPLTSSSRSSGI